MHSTNGTVIVITKIILIWSFLFIPSFFIGGSFPIINGLFLNKQNAAIRDTSLVYFWDTFGALMGGLLTGFWFLPYFGFQATATIGSIINLIIAITIIPKKYLKIATFSLLLIILAQTIYPAIAARLFNKPSQANHYLNNQYLKKRFGNILYQKISPYGVVTIGNNAFGVKNNKVLFINYRDMCWSEDHASESTIGQLLAQQLPMQSHILNIGLGCGFTADAVAEYKNIQQVSIVEINPIVAEGTKKYFNKENNNLLSKTKTKLIIQDGAAYIRNTKNKFNAVVIDIEEPTIVDSSPLFTSEYYQFIHKTLRSNGILAIWAPAGTNKFEKIIYNTLKTSFKFVSIRIIERYPIFYASDKEYPPLFPKKPDETNTVNTILQTNTSDINTLDQRVLEKYFSIQNSFGIPAKDENQLIDHTNN
jgi:spermidine synthase